MMSRAWIYFLIAIVILIAAVFSVQKTNRDRLLAQEKEAVERKIQKIEKIFRFSDQENLNEFRKKFEQKSSEVLFTNTIGYELNSKSIYDCRRQSAAKQKKAVQKENYDTAHKRHFQQNITDLEKHQQLGREVQNYWQELSRDLSNQQYQEEALKKRRRSYPDPALAYWISFLDDENTKTKILSDNFGRSSDGHDLRLPIFKCTAAGLQLEFEDANLVSKNEGLIGVGNADYPMNFAYVEILDGIYRYPKVIAAIEEIFGEATLVESDFNLKRWSIERKDRHYEIEISISSKVGSIIEFNGEPSPTNIVYVVRDVTDRIRSENEARLYQEREKLKLKKMIKDGKPTLQ